MQRTGVAIAGVGVVGRYHAQALAATPEATLVAVCRSGPERTAEAAAAYGVPCEPSYEALLARRDVEVVCLCTPSGLHARQAIAAARAGKHVLVEKPMALTLEDADAMIAACRSAGVRLGVVLQRRADPAFQAVQAALAAGELGRPVLGSASVPYFRTAEYYRSAAWRGTWSLDGGGALMNQGIHLVDLLLWFLGDVEEVGAGAAATLVHPIEVEDSVAATLRFKNGALGCLLATTAAAPGFPHRVEVFGSEGGVQIEGETVLRRWRSGASREPAAPAAASEAGAGASPTGIAPIGHARLMADFVRAVRSGGAPLVSGDEGRRSLALVLAVYEAAGKGRPVRPQ